MFIDINTYIGHWPFRNLKYNSLDGLDRIAQENGITHMVVANINGLFYKDAQTANIELLEELNVYSGTTKFIPLAMINPKYICWEKDARDMIASGFAGFEIAPIYHGYSLDTDCGGAQVMALAEKLNVPVRICSGFENFRGRSTHDSYDNIKGDDYFSLLSGNHNVPVLVTGFNPCTAGEKFAELLKTRKNTYFDTTQIRTFRSPMPKKVLEIIAPEQLCFGSMSPFSYVEPNLIKIAYTPEFCGQNIMQNGARAFPFLRKNYI